MNKLEPLRSSEPMQSEISKEIQDLRKNTFAGAVEDFNKKLFNLFLISCEELGIVKVLEKINKYFKK